MPVTIAIVSSLQGKAWVKRLDGDVIALEEGDSLDAGDIVITADGALVTLQFADGRPGVTLVDAQQVSLPEDMGQGDASSVEILDQQQVTELLRLLESEVPDLLEEIEAPGLGETGGGVEDGFDFVRLLRISESVDPQSYSFGGVGAVESLEPVEGGGTPVADDEEVSLAEGEPDLPPVEEGVGSVSAGDNSVVEGSGQSVTGSVTVTAPAGVARVAVSGVDVSGASAATPVFIDGQHGTLAITGFDPDTGTIDYVYTEDGQPADHSAGDDSVFDRFEVVVTDNRGAQASDSLDIAIVDSVPTALDDDALIGEDSSVPLTGSVLGNDDPGEDGLVTVSFLSTQGRYGSLIDNGDGTWSYSVDSDSAPVQALKDGDTQSETFSYTITDGDGDCDTATLTITIKGDDDAPPTVTIPDRNGPSDGTDPSKADAGEHSVVEGSKATVTGTMTVAAEAGITDVSLGGEDITGARAGDDTTHVTIAGDHGSVTVTDFDAATGEITYSYTENGLRADHSGSDPVLDSFALTVTDNEGDSSSAALEINVLDTEPEAKDDTAALGEDADTAINGNVLTNDTAGADPMSFDRFSDADSAKYGIFTDNGDGTWSYRVDADNAEVQALKQGEALIETFSYTVSDNDGDTRSATLTITITGNDDDVPTIEIPDGNEPNNSQPGDPESVAGDHSVVEASGDKTPVSTMKVAAEAGITSVTLTDKDGKTENIMSAQEGDDSTHVTIVGDHGSVTVTDFDAATGEITYRYTENGQRADHSGDATVLDSFALTVTDNEGDSSSAALEINILDTEPLAEDDAAHVGEDSGSPVIGNVLENDQSRPDGLRFEGFNDTSAKYGTFTDNGDGTWSYSVNTVNAAVQALDDGEHLVETFSYTVKDTDGDVSTATLTVLIDGSTDGDPNVVIQDSDGDLSVGDNSVVEGSGETVSGAMLLTATAGIATATIAGSDITGATSDNPVVVETDQGKLEITGFDSGVVEYRYTENSQRADHDAGDGSVVDRFEVVVTDTAGESNSDRLDINILDTEPEAKDDAAALGEDADTAINGNVLTNDTAGADPMSFDSFSDDDTAEYGTFTDNGDGTWSYRVDADNAEVQALTQGETLTETFSYTVSDNDGDSSTATLTITITGNDDDVPTIEIPDGNGPDGSDPDDPASVAGDHSVVEASGDKTPVSTMTVAAEAGITSVTLTDKDGKAESIMGAREGDDSTHVTIAGDHGSVTVTDFDAATGEITYRYTENGQRADHSGDATVLDSFALTVTDNEGDSSSAALEINILDTEPLAEDDAAHVGEDSGSPVIGNVLENDQSRPDGLRFEGFNDTSAKYGTFTDNGDGTWSYSVNTVNAAVQALDDGEHLVETFSYTVKDTDGDVSTATLTVLIDGSTDGDPNVVIQDSDGDLSVGDNSVVEGSGETVSGAMLLTATAGIATATIAGSDITGATSDNPVVVETDQGKLEITGFDSGVVEYRYTENSQRADHDAGDGSVVDRFEVVVTDTAGESNSDRLDINILDTEPEAKDDAAALGEDADTAINGNVLTNDTAGADPMSFDSFSDDDTAEYGTFTDNGDGTWSYRVDADNAEVQALTQGETLTETFSYTVSDNDGDSSTATLTITITGNDDDVPTIEIPDGNGPDGSDPDDPASVAGDHSVVEASGDKTPVSTMTVAAEAGITSVTLTDKDGKAESIMGAREGDDSTHVTIAGDHGSVTVTDFDAATGEITYSYTENGLRADHSGSDPVLDSFALTVTDNEGDSSSAALEINVLDTEPEAKDDTAALGEDADTAINGNVLTNDTAGADPMSFDRFSDADSAKYGIFTDNGDGTWSYRVDADNAEVQALKQGEALIETFSYTVSDNDGDSSTATLTITINGVDDDVPTIEIPDGNGPDGSDPDDSASVAGDHSVVEASGDKTPVSTMKVAADAGITSVTLTDKDGKAENIMGAREGDDSTHVTIVGDHGSVTVTDFDAATGEITYSYTENGQRADHSGSDPVLDSFALTVTDNEGDSSSADLEISILDTAPVAEDDANTIQENATSVSGNVIAGANNGAGADTQGEDKPDVSTIRHSNMAADEATSVPDDGEVSIQGQYGTLTIAADGSYSYALDNTNATVQALKGDSAALSEVFSYTLKDLDDDTSSATLTITINGVDDDVPTIEIPDGNGPDGSDPDDPASVAGDHSVVEGSRDAFDGTMTVAADAGITTVTLEGEDITKVRAGDDSTHVAINSAHGRITVIDYDPASGKITYNYTENGLRAHHSSDATVLDSFTLTVTDNEGDSSSAELEINILDTEPEAVADATETAEDTAKTYNVLTNDTQGVDGSTLTAASVRGGDSVGTVSIDPNGEITFTPAGGFEDDAVIDYTITDGDGDESSSTLTVTVAKDSTPSVPSDGGDPNTASPTATVDEDGLAGGKAGGTGDVTGEATVTKGDLGYDFGDDGAASSNAFQWNLTGLPTDLETVDGRTVSFERSADGHTLTGSVTDSNDVAESVITIKLTDQAAGKYEVTLHQALKHAAGDNENDLTFDAGYTVTDADGSQANGTLSVLIDDDSPVADDDSATQGADNENQPVTVDVLANDSVGADGATLTNAVEVVPQGASSKGSVSINAATGEVTFTPNAGAEGPVEIRYTLTDGDGDTSEAILSLTLADDSTPSVPSDGGDPNTASPTATVDEDGLAGGNAGGAGDVTGEASIAKGKLGYDFGDDGAATSNAFQWSLSGLPTDLKTADGRTVEFSVDGNTLTGSVTVSNNVKEPVITIKLTDQATGDYKVTLHQALEHAAGDDENDLSFDAGYTVTDADGSQANGTLSVLIDDDSPVADDDSATQGADNENQPVTVDVLANDSVGADGATLTNAVEVVPQGASSKGSVSINAATGEVTFTPNAGAEGPVEIRYTLTDGDGDTSEAILSLTLADDSTPSVPSDGGDPNTASPTATVDEDGLAGGNAGGTGDVTGEATVTKGDLGYSFGDDGAASSNAFQWNLTGLPTDLETVDGRTVSFERSTDGHTLTGSVTVSNNVKEPVITIKLTDQAAGKYEVTLHQALKHAAGDNENDLTFDVGYTVTDTDGSQASGKLSVVIDDDTPQAFEAQDGLLTSGMLGDINFSDASGADGIQSVLFNGAMDGAKVKSLNGGKFVTSAGEELTYQLSGDGKTLQAKTTGGDVAFEVSLAADGSTYEVEVFDDELRALVDSGQITVGDGTGQVDFSPSNPDRAGHRFVAFEGSDGGPDVVASAWSFSGSRASWLRTDGGTQLAAGGDDLTAYNEMMRFDFVDNLNFADSEPNWTDHRGVTKFEQVVNIEGTNTSSDFKVTAIALAPDGTSTSGHPHGASGSTLFLQKSDLRFLNSSDEDITSSVEVVENDDGTLSVSGVPDGATFVLETDAAFEAIEVRATDPDVSHGFSLGDFEYSWLDNSLSLSLEGADNDGDTAGGSLNLTLPDDDLLLVGSSSDNSIIGGSGDDVILGDTGGKYTVVEPAQNYNLSFILDTSGSMTAELGDNGKTRLEVAVEALKAKLDELATFEGTINVQILGFSDTVSDDENVEFLNLSPSSLDQVHAFLDGLTAEGNTNYQAAFEASGDWMKAQSVDDFNNVAYFLGDGSPNQNSTVNTSITDTNRADITEGLKAYEELAAISQVEAIGIGSDVNREILKVFDNTADGGLELVPVPYDTGTLVGDKEFLATFDKDDQSVLGQLDKWTLNDPNGTGFLTIDRNNGNSLRIDDRGTDGSISATSAAFTIPEPTGANQFYSLSFSYQTQIPTTASDGRFDNISWRLEKQTEDGEWDIVANDNDRSSTGGTEQVIANSLMGGTYRLVFVVENVASAQYVLEVHDISQSLYSYTDDELVPAGEDIIVNSAEEFEAALDGGSSSDVPQEVGNDHLIGGAGDDILFGDQIEPAGIGGEAGSGYDGLVDHLTRQNGAEPTQEETLDFIKANYDKLIDKTRTDGGQDKLEGGQGDDQLFASANDDILIGGAGDDFLLGGLGSDTFKWNLGDAGSADAPALDVVSDFQVDPDADKLSLVGLLQDFDSSSTDPDQSALDNFVFAQEENGDTVLYIKSDGGLEDQHRNADQKITLDGVSMDGQSSEDFLTLLRNNRQLDVE
ncbi:retention module-containing protein [Halomonas litopenaei]|uniref:retention module-containing protein n=1 Tax=Halomonas litopenaei TaxID=2109328 RepID=UPI003FA05878